MERDIPNEFQLLEQTFRSPKKAQVQMMFYCLKGGLTVPMEKNQKLKAFNNYQYLMLMKGSTGRCMIQPQQVKEHFLSAPFSRNQV